MDRVTLARIGIVRDGDGYSVVREYTDGTQSGAHGWWSTEEEARERMEMDYPDIAVEDWFDDTEDE